MPSNPCPPNCSCGRHSFRHPWQLPPEEEREIADRYQAGEKTRDLAWEFGISETTVKYIVKREGGATRSMGPVPDWTFSQQQDVIDRYIAGESGPQIAKDLGCSVSKVRKTLLRHGIKRRPPGHYRVGRRLDPQHVRNISIGRRLYFQGEKK